MSRQVRWPCCMRLCTTEDAQGADAGLVTSGVRLQEFLGRGVWVWGLESHPADPDQQAGTAQHCLRMSSLLHARGPCVADLMQRCMGVARGWSAHIAACCEAPSAGLRGQARWTAPRRRLKEVWFVSDCWILWRSQAMADLSSGRRVGAGRPPSGQCCAPGPPTAEQLPIQPPYPA